MIASTAGLTMMVDASVRAAVLAVLVAALLATLRVRSVSARHAAWTAVVAGMLLMPVLTAMLPAVRVRLPLMAEIAGPAMLVADLAVARDAEPSPSPAAGSAAASPLVPVSESPQRPPVPSRIHLPGWIDAVAAAYLAVLFLLLARLLTGWRFADAIVRSATAAAPGAPYLVESAQVSTPVTIGVFRSRIVLPVDWRRWADDHLRAVLAHEHAHVRRRDPLTLLAARVNRCVFWFHPLAWWLERRVAADAELVCDEAGVRAVGEPHRYAEALLLTARAAREHRGRLSWTGVGIHDAGLLTRRIERVLARSAVPKLSRVRTLVLVVGCVSAVAIAAACRPGSSESTEIRTGWRPSLNIRSEQLKWFLESFSDTEVAVDQKDRPEAERILRRHLAQDPEGPWSARLGRLYAASLVGHWVRLSERGPLQEITHFDSQSTFANAARQALAASDDANLLLAAATYLIEETPYGGSFDQWDVLAKAYLERIVRLRPEMADARMALVSVMSRERRHQAWRSPLAPPASHYQAVSALPDRERFEALPAITIAAYASVLDVSRWDDPNLREYLQLKRDLAVLGSRDLLMLAAKLADHPERGAAIFKANLTLGAFAAREGDLDAAVRYLNDASTAPASEELVYGKSLVSRHRRFIAQLVSAGEREVVADFFTALAVVNLADRVWLTAAAAAVRRGEMPSI